jgi:hypothetical protein
MKKVNMTVCLTVEIPDTTDPNSLAIKLETDGDLCPETFMITSNNIHLESANIVAYTTEDIEVTE